MPKVMGKREARRFLLKCAASMLEDRDYTPIQNRDHEHPGDPKASDRETAVLQGEIPWVAAKLRKMAGGDSHG